MYGDFDVWGEKKGTPPPLLLLLSLLLTTIPLGNLYTFFRIELHLYLVIS